jgi:predicted Rossmann fold flavoprotein
LNSSVRTKVCVIGAGPAGLMAAIFAAKADAQTVVIEKNTTAGKKLLLTGGGRCNLTHVGSVDDFVLAYGRCGRLLRHALYEFAPAGVIKFFAELGIAAEADSTGCVFPVDKRAGEVRDVLLRRCKELGVRFIFGRGVQAVGKCGDEFLIRTADQTISANKVTIATGGISYPQTGSAGDGFEFARRSGHSIVPPRPALVPLITDEKWPGDLAGTSLDNVKISATVESKKVVTTGPMLFTHDGIGGPAVLDLSRHLADFLPAKKPIGIVIDLVPATNESELGEYLIEQLSQHPKKAIANVLAGIVPRRLAALLCNLAGIADQATGSHLQKQQRRQAVQLLKKLPLSILSTRPIAEAMVTHGGVSVTEIEPKTMESKICPGLFFAGEIIDVDGPCGGYNLQMCWSTGALAGSSAAKNL